MLKLQSGINRDLHKELETLVRNRDKDKRELLDKAENFEQLANKRYVVLSLLPDSEPSFLLFFSDSDLILLHVHVV